MASENIRVIGYYPSWASYSDKAFKPRDVDVHHLTHLIYGFALIQEDGQCDHYDKFADVDRMFPGDGSDKPGNNVYGNVKQILDLKREFRHLKTIISIGGWRLSANWSNAVSTAKNRAKIVETCMHCMYNFGWDGIDLAWIFPKGSEDAVNYLELVKEFRTAIDDYSRKTGSGKVTLSVVAPIRTQDYDHLKVAEMDQYVDFWTIMAYQFNGMAPKPDVASPAIHSAPLYASELQPRATPFSVAQVVDHYIREIPIPPKKLNLGVTLYARAFYNTEGPGHTFGPFESDWLRDIYDTRDMPLRGATEQWDATARAASSYDKRRRMMVSYENRTSIQCKMEFAREAQLGGVAFWDVTADACGDRSLITQAATFLGGPDLHALDRSVNTIEYPFSDKDNIPKKDIASEVA